MPLVNMTLVKLILLAITGGVLGAVLGRANACADGTCPLTANPRRGAIYGAAVAVLIGLAVAAGGPGTGQEAALAAKEDEKSSAVIEIKSVQDFTKEVEEAKGRVVVYFHATWCPPCKQYGPVFKKVAEEMSPKVKFAKIDTDELPTLSKRFNVRYLPTTILFDGGEAAMGFTGAGSKEKLVKLVKSPLPEEAEEVNETAAAPKEEEEKE